jgi:hypothetical protein
MNLQSRERSRLLAAIMIALLLGATASLVVAAPMTVTVYNTVCDSANSHCSSCIIDLGSDNTNCWATACDDTNLQYKACRVTGGAGHSCYSNAEANVACTNCSSWRCSPINQPDPGHSTSWCDIGTCGCPGTTPDYTGNWSTWRICSG